MTRIIFSVHGEEDVEHLMLGLAARAEDTRPVLSAIAAALGRREAELFESGGHGEWEQLAESTLERKSAEGLDPGILQATREMREALEGHGAGHVQHISDTELFYGLEGEAAEKAARHKSGTSRMPARDPIMFDEEARRGITKAVQRFIVETERGAGIGTGPFGVATLDPFGVQ
jgi:hypothetical protein